MSISIRTLKIVIGILVLVSMILSMIPMFGMGPTQRAMGNFSRQVARQAPRVGKAPISATQRSYAPQAVKRPTAMPTFSSAGSHETYPYGTLGVSSGMPQFPQAPKPIVVTPPVVQAPVQAPIQEQLFGNTVTAEFNTVTPEPKIQLPATALLPGAAVGFKPVEKPETVHAVKPEVPVIQETPPTIEVGEAIQFQPQTGTVTSTPAHANTYESVEQRAEAVHGAPVVGNVKAEQGILQRAEVIEEPAKIERVDQPAEPAIALEHRATRMPTGELGKVIEPEYEKAAVKKTAEPVVEYAVVHDNAPVADSKAGKVSENIEPIIAGVGAVAAAAPIMGHVPPAEPPLRGTINVIPEGAGLERPVIMPAPEVLIGPKAPTVNPDVTTSRAVPPKGPKKRARAHSMPAMPERPGTPGEPRRTPVTPECPGRGTPPRDPRGGFPEEMREPRGEDHGGGRREPRRSRPALPVVGPVVYCPVYPPVDPVVPPELPELEDVVEDDGGVHAMPFPPLPVPRAHGLPPARGARRSWLDDLEDKVIKDKNKIYGGRFDKVNIGKTYHRSDSLVEQVLPLLHDVPASVEKPARDFVHEYQQVNTADEASYSEFINAYNTVMDAIKHEREAAAK